MIATERGISIDGLLIVLKGTKTMYVWIGGGWLEYVL